MDVMHVMLNAWDGYILFSVNQDGGPMARRRDGASFRQFPQYTANLCQRGSCGHICLVENGFVKGVALDCGMNDEAKIVEVSFFGGKLLVTFRDGRVALLEPGQIRQLAVESNALTLLPTEDIPS